MADKIPSQELPIDQWAPAEVSEIDLYEKREKIYTRRIEGFFQTLRTYTGWPLLLGYFCLPWLDWSGRQMVWFDLPARKFHIVGLTFWPQDMSMLALLLIICAYGLFLVTSLAGRVWCGFSCPQTVWTSIFMWLEQKVEGTRNQRIKLDSAPWSLTKFSKKVSKHFLWLGFAFWTAFTFVGYFAPIKTLASDMLTWQAALAPVVWIALFTFATYANAGWMREQVCKYMCPYARFQSAMFDKDTLIVSYDKRRGEPRGSRKHGDNPAALGLGDCVDCQLCVQVCPTGIDIRDGLQYECISCAMCIDACNSIMSRLGYAKNLISYTTERSLSGGNYRFWRPKTLIYTAALAMIVALFAWRMVSLERAEVSVIRDRVQVSSATDNGLVENRYIVKIANKTEQLQIYSIQINNEAYSVLGATEPEVPAGELASVRLRVLANSDAQLGTINAIEFIIRDADGNSYRHPSRFIGVLE